MKPAAQLKSIFVTGLLVLQLITLPSSSQAAGKVEFEGQLSGYFTVNFLPTATTRTAFFRYLPQVQYVGSDWLVKGSDYKWDAVLAASVSPNNMVGDLSQINLQEHRLWLRLYDDDQEFRFGLQELSFGPAVFLRTLQWFDQKNPLDPTMYTTGVQGFLFRQYQDNEINYWAWILQKNKLSSMQSSLFSDPDKAEIGGRVQWTTDKMEFGVTAHNRTLAGTLTPESRIAFDLKHDIEFSYWVEAEIVAQNGITDANMTLGADTIIEGDEDLTLMMEMHTRSLQIGNGLMQQKAAFAVMMSMADGMMDNYRATLSTALKPQLIILNVDWQRTYDTWLWNAGVYLSKAGTAKPISGLMLTMQYNH